MPEPTAAQKLSDFAKRVADSLNNSRAGQWLDKHRDTSFHEDSKELRAPLGVVSQKVATTAAAVSPEVMLAIRNAANKLADAKPVSMEATSKAIQGPVGYAHTPVMAGEYLVNAARKASPVPQETEDLVLRTNDDVNRLQNQSDIEGLRKRLAIQALSAKGPLTKQ